MEIVVCNPQDRGQIDRCESERLRLQSELRAIEQLSSDACCRVCGVEASLTFEHTPSRKAGNSSPIIRYSVNEARALEQGTLEWQGRKEQRGIGSHSLCSRCNNLTGSWFNNAYVGWIKMLRRHAQPFNAGKVVSVPLPQRQDLVVKQALTTILATCQAGLSDRFPQLRRLLTNRDSAEPLEPVVFSAFLVASPRCHSRVIGISYAIDVATREGWLWAEFTHWPIGWILSIGHPGPIQGTTNVSCWSTQPRAMPGSELVIPCQWVVGNCPADFRGPEKFATVAR